MISPSIEVDHVFGDVRRVVGDAFDVARRREEVQQRLDVGRRFLSSA